MFENMENFELLSVVNCTSLKKGLFKERQSHAFLYKINGATNFDFTFTQLLLGEGEIIFIPKGSTYTVTLQTEDVSRFITVNFNANIKDPKPCVYNLKNYLDCAHIFPKLEKMWIFGTSIDKHKCMSMIYDVMYNIAKFENLPYINSEKAKILEPVLEHIHTHIFETSFALSGLGKLSSISDTYLRRIFLSVYGITLQKYVINKRMMQAKYLIENDDMQKISDIAKAVGYDDALYFGTLFKKYYGVSPKKYMDRRKKGFL